MQKPHRFYRGTFVPLLALLLTLGAVMPASVRAEEGAVSDQAALAKAIHFTGLLLNDEYDDIVAGFAPELIAMVDRTQLQAAWATLPRQVGELEHVGHPYISDRQPMLLVRTPLQFAHATLDLLHGFNERLELTTMAFVPHVPQVVEAPPYVDEGRFEEFYLTFGEEEFPLEGTLTLPKGDGPFPAVVLVHGSGPNDRDETIGPNKPFRDIAHGLASQGIAVFRYDKRTLVHGQRLAQQVITVEEETIADAAFAARLLSARTDIGDVYVLGHSLGGMVAPYIAAEAPEIAGIIIAAGNARPLSVVLLEQLEYLLDGKAATGTKDVLLAMLADAKRLRSGDLEGVGMLLGVPVEYWIDLESRDQVAVLAQLRQRALILQGARDYQVTAYELEVWEQGLARKDNVEYRLYPNLNHLFLYGEGPATPDEYGVLGFVDPQVIEDIAAFIHGM